MLSENKRLSLLIRKNNGKLKLNDYKQFFKSFNLKKLTYIELEQSDEVVNKIETIFSEIVPKFEMIKNDTAQESKLLDEILALVDEKKTCYIYTDYVEECGMFTATTKSAIKGCLNVAFLAYNNICYLTDSDFKFMFIINYYDDGDRYNKNEYDIQRKVIEN